MLKATFTLNKTAFASGFSHKLAKHTKVAGWWDDLKEKVFPSYGTYRPTLKPIPTMDENEAIGTHKLEPRSLVNPNNFPNAKPVFDKFEPWIAAMQAKQMGTLPGTVNKYKL